jgi:(2Fe-2S) ferredoxin
MRYKKHIFVCTNEKEKGKKCCRSDNGLTIVKELRKEIEKRGLKGKVRVNKSGCLDACAYGPAIVIYPDGIWYGGMKPGDAKNLVKSIEKERIMEGWEINFKKPAKQFFKKRILEED